MALMRTLAILPLLLLACGDTATGGVAGDPPPGIGEAIYNGQCATCHGRNGGMGLNGAKDLRTSTLAREEAIAVVTEGRGLMMPYKTQLTKKEIEAVVDHVLTLRTKPE
jgi:cytochrome c6